MPPSPLESLAVVPLSALILHEAVEPARAASVRAGLERSGVLSDPIVAAPGPAGRWFVLDGAHRATALAALGVPVAVIQRMRVLEAAVTGGTEAERSGKPTAAAETVARLDAWAHDIPGADAAALIGSAVLASADDSVRGRERQHLVATVSSGGRSAALGSPDDLASRVAAMWALADRYAGVPYSRRHPGDPGPPPGTARVTWAPARTEDLAALAAMGATFPAGVSRFVVRGRVLGLRVGLDELRRIAPTGTVDDAAAGRLLDRLRRLPVRHYQEPVWVVESAQPAVAPAGQRLD